MGVRRGRSLRAVLAGSLLFGGLTTVSLAATTALMVGTASASPATLFTSTAPGTYTVTVPSGVTTVTITAVGGTGGASPFGPGGGGAIVSVPASVAPGDSLSVTVGANGGGWQTAGPGGPGEGSGGSSTGPGGGGGGGSAVYDAATPLVIAGGGGGGGNYPGANGGNADQNGSGPSGSGGGTGTLLSGPGLGGGGASFADGSGMNGGVGGLGGGGAGGGGGGGGYFGGGGGGFSVGGGGGGASYPAAATDWDTTATPSVTITVTPFSIATSSLTAATPGTAYGPVTLQAVNPDASTSPYMTTLKWKKITLPKGLKLSSTGVLFGTPNKKLAAGPSSATVQVTETATTLNGKKKVKTKTTVQATIPLTIT
jgi:hypothetical protein